MESWAALANRCWSSADSGLGRLPSCPAEQHSRNQRGADGLAVCPARRERLRRWADGKTVRPTESRGERRNWGPGSTKSSRRPKELRS